MTRPRGGYIGFNRVPAASTVNSAASGIWTLREAEALKRAGTWPYAPAGGVSPSSISGLQLWLDASDSATLFDATTGGSLVAADGGVKRWEDKSGNARHATQSTDANRPTRKTAIQGGLDVLRFDGSNDSLSIASSTATFKFLHTGASTAFVVAKQATTSDAMSIFGTSQYGAGSNGYNFIFRSFDNTTARVLMPTTAGGNIAVDNEDQGPAIGQTTWAVASAVCDTTAAAASRLSMRVNGGAADTSQLATGTRSTADSTADFGVGINGAGGNDFMNGDIGEIIMYDSALSDANREAVENYLLAKWGIA